MAYPDMISHEAMLVFLNSKGLGFERGNL